ncbi:MAG TPA: helix-turn-helix domain-containing protein, partial [Verrucomicrobiae bacterium]|nr:helix-turn-helix domain-containing protein [Verrucomicrobiae bacterium]
GGREGFGTDFHWPRLPCPNSTCTGRTCGAALCGYSARQLAKLAQASRAHLGRCSQDLFGKSPQKLYDELRMRAAPEVLGRELSVKLAAGKLGFTQHSHFTREFKEFYRITPSKFLALPHNEREELKFAARFSSTDGKTSWAGPVSPPTRQNVAHR